MPAINGAGDDEPTHTEGDRNGDTVAGRLYLFAGGGTGGHLFPGIAVAEQLLLRQPQSRILFVGSDRPIEREILAQTPFEHCILPAISLAGAWRRPLRSLGGSLAARRAALRFIDNRQPAVVIGCGGFASAAPVYAAWKRRIPNLLLEQNVVPGRATRWLSRLGSTVCVSYEETARHLPTRCRMIVTGNPVRQEIARLPYNAEDVASRHLLLVLGGSQGARSVNHHLIAFAGRLGRHRETWRVIHQTGTTDVERVRAAYAEADVEAEVAAFFEDLSRLYEQAGLVVSRAGATSLAEIACAGLPAVLLPYPYAANNHQWHNALVGVEAGAAVLFESQPEKATNDLDFATVLESLLSDEDRRRGMSSAMRGLACPEAAARVVDEIEAVLR